MKADETAVLPITLGRRPLWKRLLLAPRLFVEHYRISRRQRRPVHSVYVAFLLLCTFYRVSAVLRLAALVERWWSGRGVCHD